MNFYAGVSHSVLTNARASQQSALEKIYDIASSFIGQYVYSDLAEKYDIWASTMGIYNYKWEPIEVTTEDGYTLTMMRVLGKRELEMDHPSSKGPILIQPELG